MARALVVGCGVAGLTSAVRLAEAGFAVEVVGAEEPMATTSAVAPAFWHPHGVGPGDLRFAERSLEVFQELTAVPESGVDLREGDEVRPPPQPRRAYAAPLVEMPLFLPYLQKRLAALGVAVRTGVRLSSLDEALAEAPLVVHCAGLGARELSGDRTLRAVRGQVARVEPSVITRFALETHVPGQITYVIPRRSDCILGGTWEEGREDRRPDPAARAAVLARCARIEPRAAGARVLEDLVGLRPWRPSLRLEAEQRDRGLVVHNYGHGAAGVTLSWGCAEEVVALARAAG